MYILSQTRFNILNVTGNEHDFHIRVEMNAPPLACPHCGCVTNLYKHDKNNFVWAYQSTEACRASHKTSEVSL